MNGETAKLLRKASSTQAEYTALKRKWNRLSKPEKTRVRRATIRELAQMDDVFVPEAWKRKAGMDVE